ncbi:hypothetical protein [Halobacteriovorax sp. DPLXC-1]|uniref:hypothetical protein n=1 Tax=Halobacteriovorax sp. DPLXC-1 TaxID=3110771 RepID=UPI002FEEA498
MKTKSPLKIIFLFLGAAVLFAAIILFVAKRNLKPDAIRQVFTEQLQKALPNAQVFTQSLDYSLGVTSKVNIRKVEILYPHAGRKLPLSSFDNLQVEVPFWTMLLGYGTISININKPEVSYIEFKKGSNWENSLEKKEVVKFGTEDKASNKASSKEESKDNNDSFGALGFFANASINLNINDIKANYALRDGDHGEVIINRFALRDVGLNTTTTFELKSRFDLLKDKQNAMSFNLAILGESKLDKWLTEKKLDFNAEASITNIKSNLFIKPLNKILLTINGGLKDKQLSSELAVALEEQQFMKSKLDYDLKNGRLFLHNLNLDTDLKNFISYFIDLTTLDILINDGRLKVEGKLSSQNNKLNPNITTSINGNVVAYNIPLKLDVKNNLNNKQIRSAIEVKALEGSAKIGQSTPYVLGVDRFDYLKTSIVNVHLKDVVIPTQIQSTPREEEKKSSETDKDESGETSSKKSLSNTEGEIFTQFPLKSKVRFSNVILGESPINGQISLSVNRKQLKIRSNKLKLGIAPLMLSYDSQIKENSKTSQVKSSFKNVDISSAALFIPENIIDSIEGSASGAIDGKTKDQEYDFNVNLRVKEAKLNKINLTKVLTSLFSKVEKIAKKDFQIDGKINEISFKGRFDDRLHQIQEYRVIVDDGLYVLRGKGKIDFKTTGELLGEVVINKPDLKHDLERDYGTSSIPFRLEGVGYQLRNDYEYTVKKLAEYAGKNLLKKESDKILKKNKKKVKELFKGLFQ